MEESYNIFKIVDEKLARKLQEFFSKKLNVGLGFLHCGKFLTPPSNIAPFCFDFVQKKEDARGICHEWHVDIEKEVIEKKKSITCFCPMGLTGFIFPIIVKDYYLGSLMAGPYLTESYDKEKLKKIARAHGFDEEEFLKRAELIKKSSVEQVDKIAETMQAVINAITHAAYANYQMKKADLKEKISFELDLEKLIMTNDERDEIKLTDRENAVLKLMVKGKNNSEIAKELFISIHTAKAHVSAILQKFGVADRVQVAVKATRLGMLKDID